jgi:hypothetical protein
MRTARLAPEATPQRRIHMRTSGIGLRSLVVLVPYGVGGARVSLYGGG